jgi:trk system potassium uptake protein
MNIIIVGAGEVGSHLAKLLSVENQNIVIMDDKEDKISFLQENFDLMGVVGNPTSISDMEKAGVKSADLFIAVTPEESRNITACILARSLGAKKTLARIDNYEYLLPKNKEFFQKLGVESLIYPEMLAAKEIAEAIRRPWVRQWFEFAGGALILVGTKVREGAEVLNIPLSELSREDNSYHVVAIKRKGETMIPKGNDTIQVNDIVYFTTTRGNVEYIRKMTGKPDFNIKNITIMGGSRIAVRATQFLPSDVNIKIIEESMARCQWLTEKVSSNTMVIHGDGRDFNLLREEGIQKADAFIALTDNSETNILSCAALKRAGLRKSVAEVENLDYISLAENLDIGTVINKKLIAASHIYQMMLEADVTNVKCLTFADADVAEFIPKEGSRITKSKVRDLSLPEDVVIGGLIREGRGIIVRGDTQILPKDHVVVFCLGSGLRKVEKFFNK